MMSWMHGMRLTAACAAISLLCVAAVADVSMKPTPAHTDSGIVFIRTLPQERAVITLVDSLLASSQDCNRRLQYVQSMHKHSWFDDLKWFLAGACAGMLAWEAAR